MNFKSNFSYMRKKVIYNNIYKLQYFMFFFQIAILCAAFVAVNAGAIALHGVALAHTGNSVSSRHQDVSINKILLSLKHTFRM